MNSNIPTCHYPKQHMKYGHRILFSIYLQIPKILNRFYKIISALLTKTCFMKAHKFETKSSV